ncbi:MAG: hypothetical protein PHE55_02715 [Methylococcaceae bacterium]|nr:hypothetical protein [Methylococcaceae bacterium]
MIDDSSGFLSDDDIEAAVSRGIAVYIESRKAKIPAFVERHFSFRAALALQRKTLGRDLYKLPLNMLWALPASALQSVGAIFVRLGAEELGQLLRSVPIGLKTEFEEEINRLIRTELLELPGESASIGKDALLEAILADPELSARCAAYLAVIESKSRDENFRASLEAKLAEYGKTKLAVSELAGNIMTLAAGYAAFQKATPGLLSAGTTTAGVIAQQIAIANFWLGPSLGAWYYGLFPSSASIGLIAASTGALMMATGILAALSLVVLDPLLAKTGFHRRRLERFVQALGEEWSGKTEDRYRVKDHYVARVLDLLDLLRLAVEAVGKL